MYASMLLVVGKTAMEKQSLPLMPMTAILWCDCDSSEVMSSSLLLQHNDVRAVAGVGTG